MSSRNSSKSNSNKSDKIRSSIVEMSDIEDNNEQLISTNVTIKIIEKVMTEFKTELENKFTKMFNKLYEEKYNETIKFIKSGKFDFVNENVLEEKKENKKSKTIKNKEEKEEKKEVEKCAHIIKNKKTGEEKQCICKAVNEGYCNRHKKMIEKQNEEKEDKKEVKKETKKESKKKPQEEKKKEEKKLIVPNSTFTFDKDSTVDIYDDENNFWSTKQIQLKKDGNTQIYRIHSKTNLLFPSDFIVLTDEKKPIYLVGQLHNDAIVEVSLLSKYIKQWCNNCNIIIDPKDNIKNSDDEKSEDEYESDDE